MMRAAGMIFFAYIGFDAVSTAAQEAKMPQRDMPIGIIGSLAICTVLYVLFAYVISGIVNYKEMTPTAIYDAINKTRYAWLSTGVIFASIAFWFAGGRTLARDLMDFTLMVSMYPASIYSGWVKIVAFTVLPAGFVSMAPVGLVRAPSWAAAAFAVGGAAAYAAAALTLFHLGLRRYRRGSAPGS